MKSYIIQCTLLSIFAIMAEPYNTDDRPGFTYPERRTWEKQNLPDIVENYTSESPTDEQKQGEDAAGGTRIKCIDWVESFLYKDLYSVLGSRFYYVDDDSGVDVDSLCIKGQIAREFKEDGENRPYISISGKRHNLTGGFDRVMAQVSYKCTRDQIDLSKTCPTLEFYCHPDWNRRQVRWTDCKSVVILAVSFLKEARNGFEKTEKYGNWVALSNQTTLPVPLKKQISEMARFWSFDFNNIVSPSYANCDNDKNKESE